MDLDGEEFPDFREERAKYQRAVQLRREAVQAVRARAAGRSLDEIKELYKAELHGRGLKMPPEAVLDADVAAITGDYLPSARLLGQSIAILGKLLSGIFRPPPD
jgi:hypothetical protein